MKRVLTIQDISCLGKCSITITLPIISAMGVETTILPTAVLSTHTMFPGFKVKDLTDQLIPITDHWKEQKIHFDGIYTGYLGSEEQIAIAEKIIEEFREEETLIFVDPVMGDNGKLYARFDDQYAKRNAMFCSKADIIVPNITEACFMTDTEYRTEYDEAYVRKLVEKLSKFGAKKVVVTGVSLEPGKTGVYGLDTITGENIVYQNEKVEVSFPGTGDIFASVSVGALMRGMKLQDAFALAADYTAKTIRETLKDPDKPWYGVNFETTIPYLVEQLAERCHENR